MPTHKKHGFDPWVGKIPWRRAWQPTPVFFPGESTGRGASRVTVHGVTESRTRLKRLTTRSQSAWKQQMPKQRKAPWIPLFLLKAGDAVPCERCPPSSWRKGTLSSSGVGSGKEFHTNKPYWNNYYIPLASPHGLLSHHCLCLSNLP